MRTCNAYSNARIFMPAIEVSLMLACARVSTALYEVPTTVTNDFLTSHFPDWTQRRQLFNIIIQSPMLSVMHTTSFSKNVKKTKRNK